MLNIIGSLAAILREFIHKSFVKTMVAFLLACAIFVYYPNDYWISRIGAVMFFVALFICLFLLLLFLHWIKNIISSTINDSKIQNEMISEGIRTINNYYNRLNSNDKKIIDRFLENDNKILLVVGEQYFMEDSLLADTQIVERSLWNGQLSNIDGDKYWLLPDFIDGLAKGFHPVGGIMQYRIKDKPFLQLKMVLKMKGRLGSF